MWLPGGSLPRFVTEPSDQTAPLLATCPLAILGPPVRRSIRDSNSNLCRRRQLVAARRRVRQDRIRRVTSVKSTIHSPNGFRAKRATSCGRWHAADSCIRRIVLARHQNHEISEIRQASPRHHRVVTPTRPTTDRTQPSVRGYGRDHRDRHRLTRLQSDSGVSGRQ